ncbi:MAG: NAD(+) diphosphatase [Pseudomonadota bacterium]
MAPLEPVTFGGSALDRAAELRHDIEALWLGETAEVIAVWRGKPLVSGLSVDGAGMLTQTRDPLSLLRMTREEARELSNAAEPIFLGREGARHTFALDVSTWMPEEMPETLNRFFDPSVQVPPSVPEGAGFAELRAIMVQLSPRDAELAATARALVEWHRTHSFCANCGARSHVAQAGWQRTCPSCGRHHFPRTDPVVIMLITHGNDCLLGRSPGWPEGMYSCLAGFVEPGETLEAAVRREVREEAGVEVGAVDYLASQPWPFPASLMFGARGEAKSRKITIDPLEIDDARWVSKEELMEAFAGRHPVVKPARKGAIARYLLQNWLAERWD